MIVVKATMQANDNTLAINTLIGAKRGQFTGLANHALVVDSEHYGKVEDAYMMICHMISYYFVEAIVQPKKKLTFWQLTELKQ